MTVHNLVGSTWNKWDLHVHTPASLHRRYGADDDAMWEQFLSDLEKLPPAFKVIGINDYLFVDGYEKVFNAKVKRRLKNIDLILPIVELRLDKFGGVVKKAADGTYSQSDLSRINLHVIFDELPPDVIRQQFINALTPGDGYRLIPDAEHLKGKWQAVITPDSLRQLGEMVIAAAPKESGRGMDLPCSFSTASRTRQNSCCAISSTLPWDSKHVRI